MCHVANALFTSICVAVGISDFASLAILIRPKACVHATASVFVKWKYLKCLKHFERTDDTFDNFQHNRLLIKYSPQTNKSMSCVLLDLHSWNRFENISNSISNSIKKLCMIFYIGFCSFVVNSLRATHGYSSNCYSNCYYFDEWERFGAMVENIAICQCINDWSKSKSMSFFTLSSRSFAAMFGIPCTGNTNV